ncbi:MAG: OsmC family protein [Bacteroidales bacterium]|nr:OsmC family protein [Bacteroidales bacterium]
MEKQEVKVDWVKDMAFEAHVNGHKIMLDADQSVGGNDLGPRPKPFMLVALAGCTGMDVISILKKMRVDIDSFNVKVEGDLTDEHPKQYNKIHIIYQFKGTNLPIDKLKKAVELSEDRYCGVNAVYKKVMEVISEIVIID